MYFGWVSQQHITGKSELNQAHAQMAVVSSTLLSLPASVIHRTEVDMSKSGAQQRLWFDVVPPPKPRPPPPPLPPNPPPPLPPKPLPPPRPMGGRIVAAAPGSAAYRRCSDGAAYALPMRWRPAECWRQLLCPAAKLQGSQAQSSETDENWSAWQRQPLWHDASCGAVVVLASTLFMREPGRRQGVSRCESIK